MNIEEVRRVVAQIKSKLFKKSNSYSIGMLKSNFKGTGLQFKEHRQYALGDEIRFIDWTMLAKKQEPYIKTFEEERNVEITVIVDAASTMNYGVNGTSKLQAAIEILCLITLIAKESNDQVRPIFLMNEVIDIEKGNGEKEIVKIIKTLERKGVFSENGKIRGTEEELENSLLLERELIKHVSRKREVVILSDFYRIEKMNGFKTLLKNKNVHLFKIVSPIDIGIDEKIKLPIEKENKKQRIEIKKNSRLVEGKGQKIKILNIEDRYLEEFVREMI